MRVLNKRQSGGVPPDAVYVGRPSKWGNPFTHLPRGSAAAFRVSSRDEAVDAYRQWITQQGGQYLLADLDELRGKDLVCWCAPARCHADVLLELANA